ncbi:MAG: YwbE family protein [Sporomusaceae bacterium]|nr:YwbE family protein [Sporomusaceae bacterium]
MPYTYMLECADKTLYTGWTTDLSARLAAHNAGSGARYTRGRRPVKLVYFEYQPDKSSGQRREAAIKRLPRRDKLRLIELFNSRQAAVGEGGEALDGTRRSDIRPGLTVKIVQKQHQRSGQLTEGVVKDILTSSAVHSRGIKVRLSDGTVGRVQEILG